MTAGMIGSDPVEHRQLAQEMLKAGDDLDAASGCTAWWPRFSLP
jgi:hypothetical protein